MLNLKTRNFITNVFYAISSNLIWLIVSILVVLIVPKFIGIEQYGYFQLYTFYSSYAVFLQFGWSDGIYLRFGGQEYKNLNSKLFYSQFIELFSALILIGGGIWFTSFFLVDDNRRWVLQMVAISMILLNTRLLLFYLLQATNRIKEYAHLTMLDKITYILLIVIFLIFGINDFKWIIFADLFGKAISLLFTMITCKDIVFNKISDFYFTIDEVTVNVSVGIKLMVASMASSLIIGIVKLGIEQAWDVSTFGKVSLTLSISNMMTFFINAIGIVIFPVLKNVNQDKLASIYLTIRSFLTILLLGILILYYPLKIAMVAWLPQYANSLIYLSLVFPIFLFEGKMALLINTYFKALRREKMMLKINFISMGLSLVLTCILTVIVKDLNLVMLSIVVLVAFRTILAENYLSKELSLTFNKDTLLELLLTIVFILSGWYIDNWKTPVIYGTTYLLYLLIKRKDLNSALNNINSLIKKEENS